MSPDGPQPTRETEPMEAGRWPGSSRSTTSRVCSRSSSTSWRPTGTRWTPRAAGHAALARVAAAAYDLIVRDVQMPGLDSLALYDAVVAADPSLARRYTLVTGSGLTSAVRAFVERTGVRVLHKPYDLRTVQAAVREALGA